MEQYKYHDYSSADPSHQPFYLDFVVAQLRAAGAASILDVGCGDGNFTASIAGAGFNAYGIDLSRGGITKAAGRYPNIKFSVASAVDDFRTIFPGVTGFDAVVSVEVIEHLYMPGEFVRSASAALKPGGVVVVTTPYWGYLKNIMMAVTNRMDRALTPLWDGGHIKHWSYATLCELFAKQGLESIAFHGAGRRIPFMWSGMAVVFRKKAAARIC